MPEWVGEREKPLQRQKKPKPYTAGTAWWAFLKEYLRSPKKVGALAPSGPALSRRMARLALDAKGPIVELGPGMGQVTAQLLKQGIAPERLLLIEQNPSFVRILRQRFPDVRIAQGDAADTLRHCEEAGLLHPGAVVSSLPFLSLDDALGRRIMRSLHEALAHDGCIIQFTYGRQSPLAALTSDFEPHLRHFIALNVPPARVWVYRHAVQKGAHSA
jgi:phosphatidylethanolamine/phosphatidyl-N-methylethanolamine N-methyltransferase